MRDIQPLEMLYTKYEMMYTRYHCWARVWKDYVFYCMPYLLDQRKLALSLRAKAETLPFLCRGTVEVALL